MKPAAVSLTFELLLLDHAVEAARLLAEVLARDSFEEEADARRAAASIAAVLALVNTRLLDLERVVRGDLDPARILAPHNQKRPPPAGSDEEDIILVPWSPKKRCRRLKAELARARRQLRAARARAPERARERASPP